MYGAFFVNFLLLVTSIAWVVFKSPDSMLSIIAFLIIFFGFLAFLLSYPYYFYFIRKKHYKGLEKKVYRISLKWGAFTAFIIVCVMGLKAFTILTPLNLILFLSLCAAILYRMVKNRV